MKLTRVIEGHPAASKTSAPKHQEEAMSRTIACSLRMIGFAAILAAPVAWAQEAPPVRVRGTGEGHYPWDLRPQSTMTNANVEQIAAAVDGRTLTLKYKDEEKKIFVPADAPIVAYVPGDMSDLKPGAKVLIIAAKQPDGTLQGRAKRVGRDGLMPPM